MRTPPITLARAARGYTWTSIREWERWMMLVELTVEEALGLRSTWAAQRRADREGFDGRRVAHLNMTWIDTPRMRELQEAVLEMLIGNWSASGVRRGIAVDSVIGDLGKSTFVARILRAYERLIPDLGRQTPPEEGDNDVHRPTVFTTCDSSPRSSRSDEAILQYFRAPWKGLRVGQLAAEVKEHILGCDTSVLVLDDIHELRRWRVSDEEMVGHIKCLMSLLPVTIILIGCDLIPNRILSEGDDGDYVLAPTLGKRAGKSSLGEVISSTSSTESRFTRIEIPRYEIDTQEHADELIALLVAWEEQLPLLKAKPGMLSEDPEMVAYIWMRTSGVLGAINDLMSKGTMRAIATGHEKLTIDLLEKVKLSAAAERQRAAAHAKLKSLETLQAKPSRKRVPARA